VIKEVRMSADSRDCRAVPGSYARVRWPYLIVAYCGIGLGAVGVVVPGLPTTPFLLLAAWAASRGSERLHQWLHGNRYFGPSLRCWHEQRAVPRRAKAVAVALLVASWLILRWRSEGVLLPLAVGIFFVAVAVFLLTRPSPRGLRQDEESAHG
jgi:uncharacterized membrane protein YbaN (DUF454 family)